MNRSRGTINRSPRVDLRRPAVLVNSDGVATHVTILDVSSGGFRLEVTEPPGIGEQVRLKVERGAEYSGQIRWALGNEAGGVFLESVDDVQWTDVKGGPSVVDQDTDERRQGGERREDERRQDDADRQGDGGDDRREKERREGERRGN